MTLQWAVIAFILYVEIAVSLILSLPWIRPSIWKKVFNSRIVTSIKKFSIVYTYAVVGILILLFFDATREVRKYSNIGPGESRHVAESDALIHMRLFRAQRNLYISGFALLLFLLINRIVGLLSRSAYLEAASEAAIKQAENASKTAKNLMDNDSLSPDYQKEKQELLKKLASAEKNCLAMKKQAENLQEEYNNVCVRLTELEKKGGGDKKND